MTAGGGGSAGARPAHAGRRRGRRLETAILQATLEELDRTGYMGLTMEGVAARAETSKAVLYRRWPNRAELVRTALRQREGVVSEDLPDTGSVREDMVLLIAGLTERYLRIGPDTARGLMAEIDTLDPESFGVVPDAVMTILRRGAARGEIDLDRATPRIVALPGDLLRHELFIARRPPSEEGRAEIVDQILLPLIAPR